MKLVERNNRTVQKRKKLRSYIRTGIIIMFFCGLVATMFTDSEAKTYTLGGRITSDVTEVAADVIVSARSDLRENRVTLFSLPDVRIVDEQCVKWNSQEIDHCTCNQGQDEEGK